MFRHRRSIASAVVPAAVLALATTSQPSAMASEPAAAPKSTEPSTTPAQAEQRFGSFENASPAVVDAVAAARAVADTLRKGDPAGLATASTLTEAVSRANAAIVQEGRQARSSILSERQAALMRLRLAQTEAERLRIVEELRLQAGRRMEEQREAARLVRDRLRELRATTAIGTPGGN